MNPFDLPGPNFLVFYAVLSLAVGIVAVSMIQRAENGHSPRLDFTDPYAIAFLRGGENEALRVAAVSLVDRNLLTVVDETSLAARDAHAIKEVQHPVETAVLQGFGTAAAPTNLFGSSSLRAACEGYEGKLTALGLLPNEEQRKGRDARFVVAAFLMLGVSLVKLAVALQRGRHNVLFLIIFTVIAVAALYKITHPRQTSRGSAVLADLRQLFGALRARSATIRAGAGSSDVALLAAVFGIGALPGTAFAWTKKLFPKAWQPSGSSCGVGCGASCGSSCGGGGCGGGCGGCGGCGG